MELFFFLIFLYERAVIQSAQFNGLKQVKKIFHLKCGCNLILDKVMSLWVSACIRGIT